MGDRLYIVLSIGHLVCFGTNSSVLLAFAVPALVFTWSSVAGVRRGLPHCDWDRCSQQTSVCGWCGHKSV